MKELLHEDRPREKLVRHGAGALGDNELVAVVLGQGVRRSSVLAMATDLLSRCGGVHGLARAGCAELRRTTGIGQVRAAQVIAAIELGRRTLTRPPGERLQILHARDAVEFLMPRFGARATEQFGVMLLDVRHRVMRVSVLTVGGLDAAGIEPREVYREAMMGGAAAIVAFHNHPSGDPTPSPEDVDLTQRLAAAGVLLGIDLLDHVVLGDGRYWSFKEAGL